ncbi:MAG TPA: GNAT family N-acetyltransferase [Gammaproteobacteria bacterium]
MIRDAKREDAPQLAALYNPYIEGTIVTFEEELLSDETMAQRISSVMTRYPWIVSDEDGEISGYAYANRFDAREAYRHAVETTVYIGMTRTGRGIGSKLYRALIDDLIARGFHCAIARIALPNDQSVALHEKFGFVKVAELKEVGYKLDRWVDVGYWELLF